MQRFSAQVAQCITHRFSALAAIGTVAGYPVKAPASLTTSSTISAGRPRRLSFARILGAGNAAKSNEP